MFCPNCGTTSGVEQNYCRGCGLKLDAVAEAVAGQFPSKEYADLLRRRERFAKLGMFSLLTAGFIGFALLLFAAAQYKLIVLGPEVLYGSAIGALVGFVILSVFFFNYPKFFLKGENPPQRAPAEPVTAKLIEDRPFEPVGTVTENTTDFLHASDRKGRN